MPPSIHELSSQFAVHGLKFEAGNGGLLKAVIRTPLSQGELYMQGAHVTNFQPEGQKPVLWMSEKSVFETGKPIRGGIPICFPWFGPLASDPKAPGHGFARTTLWSLISTQALSDGSVAIELQSEINDFLVKLDVTFAQSLQLTLHVELKKTATQPATFEEALHTYFTVSDVRQIAIAGLEATGFVDKVDSAKVKPATGKSVLFDGECDRVYLDTTATCVLNDPGFRRTIEVAKKNSSSTVIWNPWIEKSSRMADFGDDEWPGMVCIETANVGTNSIQVSPGQSHQMSVTISAHHVV